MSRSRVLEAFNLPECRVLTKTISRLCRKRKPQDSLATSLLFSGSWYGKMLDFGPFNMDRERQRLLRAHVPALGEAGPSAFSPHLCCQEEEGENEGSWTYVIPGVGRARRAHVS